MELNRIAQRSFRVITGGGPISLIQKRTWVAGGPFCLSRVAVSRNEKWSFNA